MGKLSMMPLKWISSWLAADSDLTVEETAEAADPPRAANRAGPSMMSGVVVTDLMGKFFCLGDFLKREERRGAENSRQRWPERILSNEPNLQLIHSDYSMFEDKTCN